MINVFFRALLFGLGIEVGRDIYRSIKKLSSSARDAAFAKQGTKEATSVKPESPAPEQTEPVSKEDSELDRALVDGCFGEAVFEMQSRQ